MSLWHCNRCTTAYSVGAPCCPHCGSTDHRNEEELEMPKIHGDGASYAGHVDTSPDDVAEPEWTPVEELADGAGDEPNDDETEAGEKTTGPSDKPARTVTPVPATSKGRAKR